jgi:superfamily II DNA or RNA helicase
MMQVMLNLSDMDSYRLFLKIKSLPKYEIRGRVATFPDEYAARLGLSVQEVGSADYVPTPGLFDYQAEISRIAIRRRKFAIFAECGYGKTLMEAEFIRHAMASLPVDRCGLLIAPLMVIPQTIDEIHRFYGGQMTIEHVKAADLGRWLTSGTSRIGITNYEALKPDVPQGRLGALALDESSLLKSHYGRWGAECIRIGKGLAWKLALTGTPAPNDRIEFANHAVFVDAFPSVNSFLARFFINRGKTDARWELKPAALRPFYRAISHWCIFLNNPATYGWHDNATDIPPIHVHIHDVDLTDEQLRISQGQTGELFPNNVGGITKRSMLAQIAKGYHQGERITTAKPAFIRSLVDSWHEESTIIWCRYNEEQDILTETFPEAARIDGKTPLSRRLELIREFQSGRRKVLISKPKILGFGLNLQVATRQVFSGIQDSWEEFHQAVKRSNRVGSKRPLNVHIPVTDLERPMVETVLRKARRIDADTRQQEEIFHDASL